MQSFVCSSIQAQRVGLWCRREFRRYGLLLFVMPLPDRSSRIAKGVFLSYSPLKLPRTPRLARGLHSTKKESREAFPTLSGCRKTQGEHARASGFSNSNRGRRRARRPRALIFSRKNHCLAGFAAEIRRIPAESREGGRGEGACFPVHQLVKKSLGTS